MRIYFLVSLILFFFALNSYCQDENKFYLWNTTSVNIKLNELNSVKLSTKSHFETNEGIRDMSYIDLSLSRKVNDWFKLGIAFRAAQIIKPENDIAEYRPQLISNITFLDVPINIKTTNRYEYRIFNLNENQSRIYHNIFLHFPSIRKNVPRLYVGEELFTILNDVGLHLARLYGGLHVLENDWFVLDLFYTKQGLKSGSNWAKADIIGLNINFSI